MPPLMMRPSPPFPASRVNFPSRKRCAKYSESWCLNPLPPACSYSSPLRLEDSGVAPRSLGVYFKDLNVVGTGASASFQNTVGSRLNPKVAYDDIRRALRPETRDILSGFNGVVRPGEMLRKFHPNFFGLGESLTCTTVVLGSPGSGCTTFLKMLANQRETYRDVLGEVYYDSLTSDDMKTHYRGDLQVCLLIPPPLTQA